MNNPNILDKQTLAALVKQGFQPEYVFFWKADPETPGVIGKECLCQWYPSPFEVGGVSYPTAEHFMMAEKARLFGDEAILKEILMHPDPAVVKKMGKHVAGFDEKVWLQHRLSIVARGNEAKFSQNKRLREYLIGTDGKILVEASPVDQIWGIGVAEGDPRATNPEKWKGLNLLGFALMRVRSRFMEGRNF